MLFWLTCWVMQEEEGADGGTGTEGKLESLPGKTCNIILAAQYYCQAGVKTLTHSGGSEMSVLHHHHFLQSSHCAFANRHHHHQLQNTSKDQRHSPWNHLGLLCWNWGSHAEFEDSMLRLRSNFILNLNMKSSNSTWDPQSLNEILKSSTAGQVG